MLANRLPKPYKQRSFLHGRTRFTSNTVWVKTEEKMYSFFGDVRCLNTFIYSNTFEMYSQELFFTVSERALEIS